MNATELVVEMRLEKIQAHTRFEPMTFAIPYILKASGI